MRRKTMIVLPQSPQEAEEQSATTAPRNPPLVVAENDDNKGSLKTGLGSFTLFASLVGFAFLWGSKAIECSIDNDGHGGEGGSCADAALVQIADAAWYLVRLIPLASLLRFAVYMTPYLHNCCCGGLYKYCRSSIQASGADNEDKPDPPMAVEEKRLRRVALYIPLTSVLVGSVAPVLTPPLAVYIAFRTAAVITIGVVDGYACGVNCLVSLS